MVKTTNASRMLRWNQRTTAAYGQCTAFNKIVLHVDDNDCIGIVRFTRLRHESILKGCGFGRTVTIARSSGLLPLADNDVEDPVRHA